MGWFDGSSSPSKGYFVRKRSPRRSSSSYSVHHSRHSAPSIFSLGGHTNKSSSSIFSSSSSRRARPRSGFIERMIRRVRRWLREMYYYARRHPIKVFMLVIVPLITGGVLQKLLAMVGLRLPGGLGSIANSERGSSRGSYGFANGGGDNGVGESVKGLLNIAKMFM